MRGQQLAGRVVDSYTNIQTVKLFAHARREENYARGAMEELHGRRSIRCSALTTKLNVTLEILNSTLLATIAEVGDLRLDCRFDNARRDRNRHRHWCSVLRSTSRSGSSGRSQGSSSSSASSRTGCNTISQLRTVADKPGAKVISS